MGEKENSDLHKHDFILSKKKKLKVGSPGWDDSGSMNFSATQAPSSSSLPILMLVTPFTSSYRMAAGMLDILFEFQKPEGGRKKGHVYSP